MNNILPFEKSYWVLPNKLLVGQTPSDVSETEAKLKLEKLIGLKISIIINLTEENETNATGSRLYNYSNYAQLRGIETFNFPIKDYSIPSENGMKDILNQIDKLIITGNLVYMHCWGGVGRTGTTVGCYLIRHGYATNSNVFSTIQYLKRCTGLSEQKSPETDEQVEFVLKWKKGQ